MDKMESSHSSPSFHQQHAIIISILIV